MILFEFQATIKDKAILDEGSTLRWAEKAVLAREHAAEAINNPNSLLAQKGKFSCDPELG